MKNSEIPSIGNDQAIKIRSLSAMNKAGTYDDTLAYFVAGIKYKGQWYTENLATINDRKIGPGTILIDTKFKMNALRKIAVEEGWNRSIWRHLLADHLGLDTDLPDIERIGFAELISQDPFEFSPNVSPHDQSMKCQKRIRQQPIFIT